MQTEMSVEIDRPIEDVFKHTIGNVVDWSNIVVEDELLTETPEGVGSTFRTVTADRGKRMEFEGLVTAHTPPTLHAISLTGKQFDIHTEYTFEDLSGKTHVTNRCTVKGKGFFMVMLKLLGWLMRKSNCDAMEKELASLKAFVESRGQ